MHFYWHCPHFMFLASYFTSFCFMHPFSLVARLCLTLCDPMDCSIPGLPGHHQLPELAQTHIHQVGDAIQLSHPLSSPSPAFNLSPASGSFPVSQFFTSGGQSIGATASALVLPVSIHDWFPLGLTGLISFQSLLTPCSMEWKTITHSNFLAWRIPWTEEPGGI